MKNKDKINKLEEEFSKTWEELEKWDIYAVNEWKKLGKEPLREYAVWNNYQYLESTKEAKSFLEKYYLEHEEGLKSKNKFTEFNLYEFLYHQILCWSNLTRPTSDACLWHDFDTVFLEYISNIFFGELQDYKKQGKLFTERAHELRAKIDKMKKVYGKKRKENHRNL